MVSHKIRIYPNEEQQKLMYKCISVSRWVYNWGLDRKDFYYKNGTPKLGQEYALSRELTVLANTTHSWLFEVPSYIRVWSLANLQNGFNRFYKALKNPALKTTGMYEIPVKKKFEFGRGSFGLQGTSFKIIEKTLTISKIGSMPIAEFPRFEGRKTLPPSSISHKEISFSFCSSSSSSSSLPNASRTSLIVLALIALFRLLELEGSGNSLPKNSNGFDSSSDIVTLLFILAQTYLRLEINWR